MQNLTLLALACFIAVVYTQWNPRHPGWTDSYSRGGRCWCLSTNFDHDLDDITKVWYVINGVRRNIRTVCEELDMHPDKLPFRNGIDPPYNDIQCGNGPPNTAADETGCPGRTDLGPSGCNVIGDTWDTAWLASRPIFGGSATPTPSMAPPVTQNSAPGIIEAEDFEGYFDGTAPNRGGQACGNSQSSGNLVDMQITGDSTGGCNVGWVESGEWLEYTVNFAATGVYTFEPRVAARSGTKTLTISIDGVVSGSVTYPATGAWQTYTSPSASLGQVTAGTHTVRVTFTSGSQNLNFIEFKTSASFVTLQKGNSIGFALEGVSGNVQLGGFDASSVTQQWNEISRGGGFYSYQLNGVNECIDAGNGGSNSQNVATATCDSSNQNQHWNKVALSNGSFRLEKRNAASHSIDGHNGAQGQNVYLWSSDNNNGNQQWVITPAP